MYYKLRTDKNVLDYVQKISSCFFYCFEGGEDNPHMHFYLETSVKPATIRHHLRTEYTLKGNSGYSLTKTDERYPIEYIAYMMKENDWTNAGLPDSVLQEAIAHNERIKTSIKESKAARRKTIDKIQETIPPDATIASIVEYVVDYHLENGLLLRDNMVQMYATTIACRNGSFRMSYCNKICDRLFR